MSQNNAIFRREERFVLELRRLYESYGYKKFKMSKFEEYDLYLENKSFLRNANIVTVTDPNGRLLALKPDITLSIVKNIRASSLPEKVYYNENVYIADNSAGEIREATQVGLEYIGNLDIRALGEMLLLAAESLKNIDDEYRIAVSHMGFVSAIMDSADLCEGDKQRIVSLVSEKNLHGLKAFCDNNSFNEELKNRLCGLITVCGEFSESVDGIKKLAAGTCAVDYVYEMEALAEIINSFGLTDKFILDFSVLNDMNYYNGLVFQGYINGVPKCVLSGGRYDKLVQRFGCNTSAAGFAVYIDLLDRFYYRETEFDCDIFLLYSKNCSPETVLAIQKNIVAQGKKCIALSDEMPSLKYKQKAILSDDGSLKYE